MLGAGDLIDWIADRETEIVAAWSIELRDELDGNALLAEAIAGLFHGTMVETLLRKGSEREFLAVFKGRDTALGSKRESALAGRFYGVTLKLARAACRKRRYDETAEHFPYLRATCVEDGSSNPGHAALCGIVLRCDHDFWKRWRPPLDMDCRCGVIQMAACDLGRGGFALTSEVELAEREAGLSASWPPAFLPLLDFRR